MSDQSSRAHLSHFKEVFDESGIKYTDQEFSQKTFSELEKEFGSSASWKSGFSYRKALIQATPQQKDLKKDDYEKRLNSGKHDKETVDVLAARMVKL